MANEQKLKGGGGFILISKPRGLTSHDVVSKLRKITKIKKIGHGGTLDPMATGLLILAIGREFTKKLADLQKKDKEYVATLKLGAVSTTFDKEGEISEIAIKKIPTEEEIKKALNTFVGEIYQIPPIFSAKKIKGKKAYQLARKGIKINLNPQKVMIYNITIIDYHFPLLKIKIKCSGGTYIRSLANDVGKKLGCGAYLSSLKRTKIGEFLLKNAIKLSALNSYNWRTKMIRVPSPGFEPGFHG